jgi:SnoaL-like polyketide cyclase
LSRVVRSRAATAHCDPDSVPPLPTSSAAKLLKHLATTVAPLRTLKRKQEAETTFPCSPPRAETPLFTALSVIGWVGFDRNIPEAKKPGSREGGVRVGPMPARVDHQTRAEDLVVGEAAGRVAVRWSSRGTNRDVFLGLGPTGRMTPYTGIEMIEVREGQIVRRRGEWDITAHQGAAI